MAAEPDTAHAPSVASSRRGWLMGLWPGSSQGSRVAKSALVPSESLGQESTLAPSLPKVDKTILFSPLLAPPAELFLRSSFCLSLFLLLSLPLYIFYREGGGGQMF